MSWETFYAACFLAGFLFNALLLLLGSVHFHIPGVHLHGFHGHGASHAHGGHGSDAGAYFNPATISAFLAWFGGTGYLLIHYSAVWALLALGLSTISGLLGAALVFWIVVKYLLGDDKPLDPADYDMVGVLGRISSTVLEGGVGEMIFSQEGVRRSACVRSATGGAISRGTEVIVTEYKRGVAYVRPWEEMTEMDSASAQAER